METQTIKAVITVVGKDHQGIISRVSTELAKNSVNILDISQTIIDGFFSMIMVVDISSATIQLSDLNEALQGIAEETKTQITCQHEDIFNFMHRV
ncbi:ACT domain-containing protein [Peptococcus simiae]|uniref:UPF0237 protein ACKQTC_01820 n=1 Tax=Peptococcus simiae TaxID=1643805 RepID=A0ABW9GY52_9FIRM